MERNLKEAVGELKARLDSGDYRRIPVLGLKGAAQSLMLREAVLSFDRPILAIAPQAAEAESIAAELGFFLDEPPDADAVSRRVHLLRGWELKPLAHLSPAVDIQGAQFAALYALLRLRAPVIVTSVEAIMMRTIPSARFADSIVKIAPADAIDLETLIDTLAELGYQRVPQVEELGDFSVRGGIVDVFSPLFHDPLRIEFEDEIVVSIRRFEAATQRSLGSVPEAVIIQVRYVASGTLKDERIHNQVALRAAEIGLVRRESGELLELIESGLLFPGAELLMPYVYGALGTIFDYLPDATVAWLIESGRGLAAAHKYAERIDAEASSAQERPVFYPPPEALYMTAAEWERAIDARIAVETGSLITVAPPEAGRSTPIEVNAQPGLRLTTTSIEGRHAPPSFEPLVALLNEVRRTQGRALLVVEGPSQAARLKRHLEAYQVEVNTDCKSFAALLEWPEYRPVIMEGELAAGVGLPLDGIYLFSEEEIFGEPRVRRRSRPVARGALLNLEELKPDDYVVHIDHGIGRYRGLKHLKVADVEGDFLNLEYAGNDTMYVPVERINLVQRYIGGGDGTEPKLDRLGSGSWEKVKRRTKEAVLAMASELLEVYAAREVMEGHAFPHPGSDYHEFAERFEFEETPDQLAAIDEVVRDMARAKPMDRLICGDAGFGKTEVAMRAAFMAVMDGRQVAMLVPTTILAEQHWNTFTRRFKDYPVRIEMVSRFRTPRENKQTIEDLRRGAVDIVIGTHRLLQSDVEFKRLGLLIIDEEHRFGVADKERIKRMRKLVDVLTLTATPIPRTLHMAMLGIRDLSVIQTPPPDRQSVRTFVAHFDDALLREVILRELNRGGQVFFVHNRVENIDYIARHVRAIVPEARTGVAHGQMNERELERVMRDFIENRINVLVCSAIIESGLDIPNANTMIINRADHFGLAQLYQLRGRVGRSRQKAYAYLLIPGEHIITRDAKRRIEALRELVESDAGTGFQLSMRDLEHRGAGNLLGREQSGQIAAVGFELYTEMMEQAIHELRGEPQHADFEPELRLGIPAYIPQDFVPDENERLVLYRRMARAESDRDLDELRDELRDRFGPLPTLIDNLTAAMSIRRKMKELLIMSAIMKGEQLEIRFHSDAPVDPTRLAALAAANRDRIRLTPAFVVMVRFKVGEYAQTFAQLDDILQALAACEKLENWSGRSGELAN